MATGRTAYVTFKDPKALEIALLLSVWLCALIGYVCGWDFSLLVVVVTQLVCLMNDLVF